MEIGSCTTDECLFCLETKNKLNNYIFRWRNFDGKANRSKKLMNFIQVKISHVKKSRDGEMVHSIGWAKKIGNKRWKSNLFPKQTLHFALRRKVEFHSDFHPSAYVDTQQYTFIYAYISRSLRSDSIYVYMLVLILSCCATERVCILVRFIYVGWFIYDCDIYPSFKRCGFLACITINAKLLINIVAAPKR